VALARKAKQNRATTHPKITWEHRRWSENFDPCELRLEKIIFTDWGYQLKITSLKCR
jgi:hypothetical protein